MDEIKQISTARIALGLVVFLALVAFVGFRAIQTRYESEPELLETGEASPMASPVAAFQVLLSCRNRAVNIGTLGPIPGTCIAAEIQNQLEDTKLSYPHVDLYDAEGEQMNADEYGLAEWSEPESHGLFKEHSISVGQMIKLSACYPRGNGHSPVRTEYRFSYTFHAFEFGRFSEAVASYTSKAVCN